jgi:tetratricopeptide (TPR) repeat protein/class 3 adenylate cyclase
MQERGVFMKRLVPAFILNQQKKSIFEGQFEAATMFIDISGFTAMTQTLMKNGKEGAEILTSIINNIFTPAIDAIYNNCGFISTFAGDAFTAIFPSDDVEAGYALYAGLKIQSIFGDIGLQKSKFGDFHLSVKIGLSAGNVEWKLIENEVQNAYFFRGEAIDNCAGSEHQCSTGDSVIDFNMMDVLKSSKNNISCSPINKKHYLINKDFQLTLPACKKIDHEYPGEMVNTFEPQVILDRKLKGEFRDIISAFISFEENENLLSAVLEIIALTNQYGGYFNKVDFGDKGAVALVLFGAPIGRENLDERAADFALKVKESGLKNGVNLRIGLTFGKVFAGFVGSDRRSEYTALGMTVNLSARFMMKAEWGEIYLDRRIYTNIENKFQMQFVRDEDFKGFTGKIPFYSLISKKEQFDDKGFSGELVGRAAELEELYDFTKPLTEKRFGGVIYIDGVAGIGKSRLVNELKHKVSEYNWLFLPCDEILKKSFNPFIYYFNNFFDQSEENTIEINMQKFESAFSNLISDCEENISSELEYGKPFLGALLNLFWEDSIYEQIDAKTRYDNTLYAIKSFFKVLSQTKSFVLELDDGHWIDNDSLNALATLTRNVDEYPFIIISACRYNDDETIFEFGLKGVLENRLELNYLDKELSRYLIDAKIAEIYGTQNLNIPEDVFEFIWEKSAGNPFYIEQIIMYLHDHKVLDSEMKLKRTSIEIPSNINAIIVARIDRLTEDVKEVIKTASVIGKEFVVKILSSMLNSLSIEFQSDKLQNVINTGKTENIWNSIQEIKYIFKHALIRESVYEIQLKERLRELHKLAAETIEDLYMINLDDYLEELAFHYEKAEITDKAIDYLDKAGYKAKYNFQNEKALDLYSRKKNQLQFKLKAEDLTKLKITEQNMDVLNNFVDTVFELSHLFQLTGKYEQAKNILDLTLQVAKNMNDIERQGKVLIDLANYSTVKGNIQQTIELLKEAEKIFANNKDETILGKIYRSFGTTCMRKGDAEKAFEYFAKELEIFKNSNNTMSYVDALGNYGVMNQYLGKPDEAFHYLKLQLELAEDKDYKIQIARALSNIGWVYRGKNNIVKAIDYYNKSIVMFQEMGIKNEVVRIQDNTGFAYQQIGKFTEAAKFHRNALDLALEIGDQESVAYCTVNLAHAYAGLENFIKSREQYIDGIAFADESGYKELKAEALIHFAELLYTNGMIEEANSYVNKGLKIAKEIKHDELILKAETLQKSIKKII